MKTVKRLHVVVVVLVALLAVAMPPVGYAWSDAGAGPGPSSPGVEITGTVQSTGDAFIVVDGQTIQVDANTRMNGQFVVGDVVTIHASAGPDGNLVAREVGLLDQPIGRNVRQGASDTLRAGSNANNVQWGAGDVNHLTGAGSNTSAHHQGDNHNQGQNHWSNNHNDDHCCNDNHGHGGNHWR